MYYDLMTLVRVNRWFQNEEWWFCYRDATTAGKPMYIVEEL